MSNVPADPNALVYLVATGNLAQDGTNDPASVPKNYDIIASATPTSTSNSVTFNPEDYVQNLPNTGVIRAIVYYNKKVVSNFSNAIEINIIKVNKSTLRLILQTVQMVLELNL